jgi:hypothetical protein
LKHIETLAFSKKELGKCKEAIFEVTLKDPSQKPIGQKPYNHSKDDLTFLKAEVEALLAADLIEEVSSPWAQPCVIAKRNMQGKIVRRLCIDYRRIN